MTKTMCGADCWTDHRLVVSKLNLRIQPAGQPQGKTVPKSLDVSKLKQDSKRQTFINDICSRLDAIEKQGKRKVQGVPESQKKVREKSRECHKHKLQPFPDTKRKRKPTNQNKHKSNKRTKSTKISSLFPKRGNRYAKRTEKHKNKMTQGKT